ncbi:hypothetical protein N7497_006155 [Penicillium chrysogenum]|nr:hypothetical protein N7497_006155 [Penicillium chrysogenum]
MNEIIKAIQTLGRRDAEGIARTQLNTAATSALLQSCLRSQYFTDPDMLVEIMVDAIVGAS